MDNEKIDFKNPHNSPFSNRVGPWFGQKFEIFLPSRFMQKNTANL